MVDQKSLRMIGFGFSVITVAVTFVAAVLVADMAETSPETASIQVSAMQ